jgi:hypothetical protein
MVELTDEPFVMLAVAGLMEIERSPTFTVIAIAWVIFAL